MDVLSRPGYTALTIHGGRMKVRNAASDSRGSRSWLPGGRAVLLASQRVRPIHGLTLAPVFRGCLDNGCLPVGHPLAFLTVELTQTDWAEGALLEASDASRVSPCDPVLSRSFSHPALQDHPGPSHGDRAGGYGIGRSCQSNVSTPSRSAFGTWCFVPRWVVTHWHVVAHIRTRGDYRSILVYLAAEREGNWEDNRNAIQFQCAC